MNDEIIRQDIISGRTSLGIEFGSTRIKAVLISSEHEVIATGSFNWENILENGLWVYHLEDALKGLRYCYGILAGEVMKRYSVELETIGSIGVSGMMHGIIALDAKIFSEIVRKLPDSDVTIETDERLNTTITCEKAKFNIPGKSGEDFDQDTYIIYYAERRISVSEKPQECFLSILESWIMIRG